MEENQFYYPWIGFWKKVPDEFSSGTAAREIPLGVGKSSS